MVNPLEEMINNGIKDILDKAKLDKNYLKETFNDTWIELVFNTLIRGKKATETKDFLKVDEIAKIYSFLDENTKIKLEPLELLIVQYVKQKDLVAAHHLDVIAFQQLQDAARPFGCGGIRIERFTTEQVFSSEHMRGG